MAAFGPDQVFDQDYREVARQAREEAERARDQVREQMENFRFDSDAARELRVEAENMAQMNFDFKAPFAFAPQRVLVGRTGRQVDALYDAGTRAIDSHRYEEALEDFNQVVSRSGPRADGALYWKAYTLNKLGRRDDALAAIAELRKSYASSGWYRKAFVSPSRR